MKGLIQPVSSLLLILLAGAASIALTVEYASLEELTIESSSIIHGKVKSAYSKWEDKNIYTYTTIEIVNDVKGDQTGKKEIVIKQLGGTVGEIGQEVNGSPKLKQDSEVFLFLVNWKNNYWIHSIILGYYEVVERKGEKIAVNNFNNVYFIDPVTKKSVQNTDKIKTSYELNSLISDVKRIIGTEN